MRRGEVWWLELADEKRRPALVLTRTEAIPYLHSVVIAPVTTRVRGIPSELVVGPEDGMPRESAVAFDNIRVTPKANLTRRIADLSHRMPEACRALAAAFDC